MPRKKRFEFDPSNTADNGDFIVGKCRPPETGKFRKGDGRKRGRRPKGTNNLATDLRKELDARVAVTVGGVQKKVSRQRAIMMRLADNATKGQPSSIALAVELQQRLVEPLLEKERKADEQNWELSRLSLEEKLILEYLLGKADGIEDATRPVVGVLPIYKNGAHLDWRSFAHIKLGLLAYGVHVDDGSSFPPTCRINQKVCDS